MAYNLRITPEQYAAFQKRAKRKVKLEPDEPTAWQPLKRDRQVAKPTVARAGDELGKPATLKRAVRGRLMRPPDRWPAELAFQCRAVGLPTPSVNYPFLKEQGRRFLLDCAWPAEKLVVEVDGGVHRIRDKFDRDLEKHRLLFDQGWRLLRVSPGEVNSGAALGYVARALMV